MSLVEGTTARVPGYKVQELAWQDEDTVTFRAVQVTTGMTVLIRMLRAERPTPTELHAVRQDFELARTLPAEAVVRPLALESVANGYALVLEETGARPLADIAGNGPLHLANCLDIAASLAATVGTLHSHQTIHNNLSLNSVWLNARSRTVTLTDFRTVSRIARGTQQIQARSTPRRNLEYLSPEQTGRMNRSVDYRSDYYSIGVILYRLLIGRLPFESTDLLELIHCHLARAPAPPHVVSPGIPEPVSAIVLKLLAKTAEERYQSSMGLVEDLRRCLKQWRTDHVIESIPLGASDISEVFRVSERLYGREAELASLVATHERCTWGAAEMLLVSGSPGIGKSLLVNEIHKPTVRSHGYFIIGKFDQYQRSVPYASLIQAFQQLVFQLLGGPDEEIAKWKQSLIERLGSNLSVIIEVIPEVGLITGPQPASSILPPAEARHRFNRSLCDFIATFAHRDHPLAMFLDDLQWADPASLSLLPVLLSHPSSQYLLVIGAFRDSEVGAAHPVSLMIDEARRAGVTITEVKLYTLGLEDVCHLLRDTLRCTVAAVSPLAALVHRRTDGNPFFVVQLLHFLHDCSLIRLDPLTRRWCWDLPEISARGVTGSVVDLMTGRINKLSVSTREALKTAACLGASFTLRVMSLVMQQSPASALRALTGALREGLVYTAAEIYHVLDDDSAQGSVISDVLAREVRFDFLHDRVQQAAYALIPEPNRPHFRLQIGRLLRAAMSDADLEDKPFDVVNNLNFGAHLLLDPGERYDLARLNLTAGRKARTALAYDDAVGYLRNGLRLLPPTCWEEAYESSIALHEECFECEYLTGNFAEADSLFGILQAHARSKLEKARAYYTKVLLSTSLGRADEAVHVGIEGLRLFGLRLPTVPTKAHLLVELALVRIRLGRRRPEQLLDLPSLTDADQEAAIRLLMIICPAAYFKNPDVMMLAALKIVKMSLRSGNASVSSFGYILFALMLGAAFGRYELGHAFGRLAVALSRDCDEIVLRCKVLMIFGGFVNFWRQPIDTSTALLAESFRISLDAGDVQYANYSVLQILFLKFFRGAPLSEVLAECERYEEFVIHTKDTFAVDNHRNWKQSALALQGMTNGGAALASDSYDEAAALARFKSGGNLTTLCYYYTLKSQLAYLFGDDESALAFGEQAEALVHCALSQIVVVDHYLYFGLAAVAALRRGDHPARRLRSILRRCRKKLRTWAAHCPANFRHHSLLLDAETAAVSGQPGIAMRSYDAAVESATANQALQLLALSNELAARFYLRQGQQKVARTYMIDAHGTYVAWGAFAKLKHLESERNELFEPLWPAPLPLNTERGPGAPVVMESPSRNAILGAAQAISSEVRLDRLLEKLIRLVLQCAGAQNAAFAFEERGVLRIEAEGRTDPDEVRVLHSIPVEAAASVCSTVIQQAARTRSMVVLHDASLDPHYRTNPYVMSVKARSVLGLPIVLQGSLLGVLYMENNLMPGVFTPERLEQITIIASEVVIALENARLQHRLQTRDSDLQAAMRKVELLESVRAHLSKFVPQYAQRAIAADPENPELEKRERDVSILFLDVAGYTRISETLDKELVDSLIERYFSEFLDEIRRNGGDVNETTGDGLMVIFQDPDPMQHAILAAQAAIAIRSKTRRLNAALAENATPVLVNIGINSGLALVGVKRFEGLLGERYTYTASGPVTNLAARLATTANDGEILVSDETARRVAHNFLLKDLGARRFKNVKDSVRVFGLLQVNAAEEREAGR